MTVKPLSCLVIMNFCFFILPILFIYYFPTCRFIYNCFMGNRHITSCSYIILNMKNVHTKFVIFIFCESNNFVDCVEYFATHLFLKE